MYSIVLQQQIFNESEAAAAVNKQGQAEEGIEDDEAEEDEQHDYSFRE